MRVLIPKLRKRTRNVRNELYKLVTEIAESRGLGHFYRTADPKWCLRPRLRRAGIEPEQIVTDGSRLYPKALKEVWPAAAHQLCLFHESRQVTGEIYRAVATLRKKEIPKPPPVRPKRTLKGMPGNNPSPEKLAFYQQAIARVFALKEQGNSIREISRQTGYDRHTR